MAENNKDFLGRDKGYDFEKIRAALQSGDVDAGSVRRILDAIDPQEATADSTENTYYTLAQADDNPHFTKTTERALAIGTMVATTVVEDSIILGLVSLGKKYVLPKAAKTVVTSGWSLGGGIAALALRSGITGVSGIAGAVIANTLVHLTIDIVQIVRSMPDPESSDDN